MSSEFEMTSTPEPVAVPDPAAPAMAETPAGTAEAHPAPEPEGFTPDPAFVPADAGELSRLTDVTVELAVEIGRTRMTLGQTLELGPGSVVTLDRQADKPVDLLVNGKVIARGEVVVTGEEFGLRVTEVVAPSAARNQAAGMVPPAFEPGVVAPNAA